MSMISEQIKELRNYERIFKDDRIDGNLSPIFGNAANTIELLSVKLQDKIISGHRESFYDEMRKELKHSIINLSEDHYNLSEFMRVIDEVFVKYRNKFEKLQETE